MVHYILFLVYGFEIFVPRISNIFENIRFMHITFFVISPNDAFANVTFVDTFDVPSPVSKITAVTMEQRCL